MFLRLCGPPSIPLSFTLQFRVSTCQRSLYTLKTDVRSTGSLRGCLTNLRLSLSSLFLFFFLPFSARNYLRVWKSESHRSRTEVFQPHLPVRLPCYDLAPITGFTLGRPSRSRTSGASGFHGLTGGVYKARERIHRAMADARLLANPASWGRVADPSPN